MIAISLVDIVLTRSFHHCCHFCTTSAWVIWDQGESHIWVRFNEKLLCYCIELFRWYSIIQTWTVCMLIFGLAAINILKTCYIPEKLQCTMYIDTSKKALKMLSIIIINIFIDCYTRFYYFFLILGHIICPSPSIWQSADGRVTSDHCRVTVQWLFSKIFLITWNV